MFVILAKVPEVALLPRDLILADAGLKNSRTVQNL